MDMCYTWPAWPDTLKQESKEAGSIQLVSFGSLVNPKQIQARFGDDGSDRLVIAYGVSRIFNYGFFEWEFEEGKYTRSSDPTHNASLNVKQTDTESDYVNGVLINIAHDTIDEFARHEEGFDIIPVRYEGFNATALKGTAYMLSAPKGNPYEVPTDHLPNESYLAVCLEGAALFGPEFLAMWLDTTYLADGTLLKDSAFYRDYIAREDGPSV